MEAFAAGVAAVDSFMWGWFMIIILLGTHLIMTVRTKFIQRKIGTAIKLSVTKDPDAEGDVSQFGALATALAATIGTGNIVGVATGLLSGGPGAVFWMWITGVFGIATKYSECYISVRWRIKDHKGEMLGGAMYALQRGFVERFGQNAELVGRVLGIIFAFLAAVASFGIGASVQSNSLTGTLTSTFDFGDNTTLVNWIICIIVVILVGIVVIGGVKSITRVTEKLVPIMAVLYALGCIIICCMNWNYLGEALALICTCAFTGKAAFGGAVGSTVMLALQFGFKRGLFSNESGMGSAPLVASSATTRNPARQALVSMSGTFWDTVIICALTGLMLVSTMCKFPEIGEAILAGEVTAAAELSTMAFQQIPVVGPITLAIGMICFTYSTMLGWCQYGNRAIAYLFGKKGILPFQIVFLFFVGWGCVASGSLVWDLADIANAAMALPNVIAVLALSGIIAKETQHYVYDGNLDEIDDREIPTDETR